MSDPRETPDFYGYGSDYEVALDTGRRRQRLPDPPWCLGDAWRLLAMIALGGPWLALQLALWPFGRGWLAWHRGQCEPVVKAALARRAKRR